MSRAKGSNLIDTEGRAYIDYCLGFGPMILGHGHPELRKALQKQVDAGVLFGTPSELEITLAKKIRSSVTSIEEMRFTNSGTEATMHALRLARAYTGRNLILKFEGGYHGSHDYSLIRSGSGALNFGSPSSPGIPSQVSSTVLVGRYNHLGTLERLFLNHGKDIAAVILEPVMGNAGLILPDAEFLKYLRQMASDYGALLIFDEVITGYRFRYGAFQDMVGIRPDITVLGKIIGGGLPIGLFGGRTDIMELVSPHGDVYEAGTFSANPLSMTAGIATLSTLEKADYGKLSHMLGELVTGFSDVMQTTGVPFTINSLVSAFQIFFGTDKVNTYDDAMKSQKGKYMEIFLGLLKKGIYMAPGQYETNFISFAHDDEDIARTVYALREMIHAG